MSEVLRYALGAGVLAYFVLVVYFLKRRLIDLKYSLVWLLAGICMACMVLWPNALSSLMGAFGITVPVNGLFLVSIGFVFVILMSLTSIVSKQTDRIKQLVQHQAVLEICVGHWGGRVYGPPCGKSVSGCRVPGFGKRLKL